MTTPSSPLSSLTRRAAILAAALACAATTLHAQDDPAKTRSRESRVERSDRRELAPITVLHLKNANEPNDGNELLTGLRLMLDPAIKIYLVPSQNAIALKALPEELDAARKMLDELDRPRPRYRIGFALTEVDGGKRNATEHFSLTAADGQRVTLKQGSKVPVSIRKFDASQAIAGTEVTYLDVGRSFDVTASGTAESAQVKYKVEQSSVADEKLPASNPTPMNDPVIRQTVLEGTSTVTLGKPVSVTSLDVPGTTRHLDVEITVDRMP